MRLLIRFLIAFECCTGALAEQNGLPRLVPLGCNFDGGLAWLALGKASADPELNSFRVEIPDVDLERVDGTISPSSMDMFMPYGQGPVVGPISVVDISISPRIVDSGPNGNVQCGTACAYNNYTFDAAGGLVPMVHGTPSASGGVESGGDGSYIHYGTFRSELDSKDVFARFSLDLGENTNWYVQGSWAQAENASDWIQWVVSPNNSRPNTLFANNPTCYEHAGALERTSSAELPPQPTGVACRPCRRPGRKPAARRHRRRTCPFSPTRATSTSSTATRRGSDGGPNRMYRTLGDQKQWNAETGVTGEVGGFTWEAFYNHSTSELSVTNPNNTDNAKYLASLDAVSDAGTIKCWVSTQPQFASLYPGCVPSNITTPDGISAASYDYLRVKTSWNLTQDLDNVGASIGGGLWGFGLPAGEITANLSVDARWQTYVMESDFLPSDFVNCTGLRACLAAGNAAPLRWVQNTVAPVDVDNHVYEGALELNVPLLKEVPGFQDLSTNLAYRYTKYSSFDAVDSWKIGLNWQIVDSLRIRSTYSSDIRAPNLNDLFQPAGVTSSSYNDRLTGGSAQGIRSPRVATALTPEEATTDRRIRADADRPAALQLVGRFLGDPTGKRDHQPQLCERLCPGHLPGQRA